ncbi:MAG: nitroreductase family protein [Butyrivibrio sp.]|nr:nitroreductase family protein [Butyrivibrio sp.]
MLKDLVQKNRSYRGFDENYTFTKEELEEYIDLARICPSGANLQGLKYHLVYEKEAVEELLPFTHFAAQLPELGLPRKGSHPTAYIVICQDMNITDNPNRLQKDIGIVAQTMLLYAAENNLGGLMIGNFELGNVKKVCKLPDNLSPVLLIALGKPTEKIVLVDVDESGNTKYYRDENDVHYVPKRKLSDVIV